MLDAIKLWIITILIGAFIVNIVDMILPDTKLKPYINLVLNFIFVFIVITPIVNYFSENKSLEDSILSYMNRYNKEYVDSVNKLSNESGNESLSANYEDGLQEVLKLKLEEYGYDLEEIEFKDNNINKITLKEKNSNNDNNEDIQSKEDKDSTQVFKEETYTIDLDKKELKDDLSEILDISIETIEID